MKNEEIVKTITEHTVLITETRDDVRQILTNHLPHINKKIDKFYWVFVGGIVSVLIGLATLFLKSGIK